MNMQSDQINELVTALAKAQGEIKPAIKDCNNAFFNSKYADLNSVWNSCRDTLSKNNLSVIQTVETLGENMSLVTTLAHGSGQWIKSHIPIILPKEGEVEIDKHGKPKKQNRLHLLGSAMTYLRRYSLASIVGIASDEDDDGNSFSSNSNVEKKTKAQNIDSEPNQTFINKQQIREYNELYEVCARDENFKKYIDEIFFSLNVSDLSKLDEENWKRFIKSFKNHINNNQWLIKNEISSIETRI